jgi:hypothetical protein
LKEKRHLPTFEKIDVDSKNFRRKLNSDIIQIPARFIGCERLNNWATILELNVDLEDPFLDL